MKTLFSLISLCATFAYAQSTATNFVANDCAGVEHDLFAELNDGKVVVICWVMPCGLCINPAANAQAGAQSFFSSHPNRVKFYVADDFGNTSCGTIYAWCSQNGITTNAYFSDSKIKMSDYGADGMPKTVVLGGPDHQVFFNANGVIDHKDVQNAISAALAVSNVNTMSAAESVLKISPNPAAQNSNITLEFELRSACDNSFSVQIFDLSGSLIKEINPGPQNAGPCSINADLSGIAPGMYQIRISGSTATLNSRFIIN